MFEFVLSLPEWVGVAAAMVAATVIGLAIYCAAYRFDFEVSGGRSKRPNEQPIPRGRCCSLG